MGSTVMRRYPEDVVLVIDTSSSMNATDYPPTRLGAAKIAAQAHVIERLRHEAADRIAVVGFADRAEVVLPLTDLRGGEERIASAIDRLASGSMTALGEGLAAARTLLRSAPSRSIVATVPPLARSLVRGLQAVVAVMPSPIPDRRVQQILLLTDGYSNTGRDPVPVGEDLKRQGVVIDVIGIGGAPEAVDEPLLKKIASVVDGQVRYGFIRDTQGLVTQFRKLAMGITRTPDARRVEP